MNFGGWEDGGSAGALTETYDGTSWSAAPVMPGNKNYPMAGGSQSAAIAAGGHTGSGNSDATFEFDGAVWTLSLIHI